MKKYEDTLEQVVAIALAIIIGMTAFVLTFAWIANRPPQIPGTGIPGETLKLRENTILFVQENEALLQQAVQELKTMHKGADEVHYHQLLKESFANNDTHRALENQTLIDLLENTDVNYIDGLNGDWIFLMTYSEDSLFKRKIYSFVFSDKDPSVNLACGPWRELGNGKSTHWDTANGDSARSLISNSGNLYLEEIGNGFWYFYEYSD